MKIDATAAAIFLTLAQTSSSYTSSSSSSSSTKKHFGISYKNHGITAFYHHNHPKRNHNLIISRGGGGGDDDRSTSLSSTTTTSTTTTTTTTTTPLPESVSNVGMTSSNWSLLSSRAQNAIQKLIENDVGIDAQRHVYGDWPEVGCEDDGKIRLGEQLADLDEAYPGGLSSYLSKSRTLLEESSRGTNPFSDYTATIPQGELLSFDNNNDSTSSMTFTQAEEAGLEIISDVAFVLVAGGLGERLGYSGIKLSLETNLVTNVCYLEMYIRYIQAMERLAQNKNKNKTTQQVRIPLVIMTSGDTDPLTRQLLQTNHNFGMHPDQIHIVCQDKVPALRDSNAGLALNDKDRWLIQTKPHGHGDVHHLLHKQGLVKKWVEEEGRKYVVFLQDTNALIVNSVIPTLGVSWRKGFVMNSICIPRLAGEAAGAIARLEHKTDPQKSLVINVEYNQLDPLLRTQGDCLGDVSDPSTGYSPFPGNSNILVIELSSYAKTLRGEDEGVVTEFVNPKYKDDVQRTEFKKPTRLECMMQDIPKLFQKELGGDVKVGFTMFDRWFSFSPAKNSLESGIQAVQKGSKAPGTMSSAESDKYIQNQRKLQYTGMTILPTSTTTTTSSTTTSDNNLITVKGIPITPGPRIILCPSFAITQQELLHKVHRDSITITTRSSLVLDGPNLIIKKLDLDGALVIRIKNDLKDCYVEVDGLVVRNRGYELREVVEDGDEDVEETVAIRGYTMVKHEVMEILVEEEGKWRIGANGFLSKIE